MVHINQLGLTTAVDATKLKYGELGQLLETLAIEEKIRSQTRRKELDDTKKEQVEFLLKCRNLAQSIIPGPMEADTDKSLEKEYQLFESVVSTPQVHMQNTKEEKKKKHLDYWCNSTQPSKKLTKCYKTTWKSLS